MKLYHGTNNHFTDIDLSQGLKYKDFGQGFYLTPERATAVRMAIKKAKIFGGTPLLVTYDFNENILNNSSSVKVFPIKASVEWFLFIRTNRDRNNIEKVHNYDIVVGPIADDGVVLQLTNFQAGIISPEQAAKQLQDKFLDQQYCFCTEQSLQYLTNQTFESL